MGGESYLLYIGTVSFKLSHSTFNSVAALLIVSSKLSHNIIMEHPYPVHRDGAWVEALETSVLATEEEPVVRLEDCCGIHYQFLGFKAASDSVPPWPISSLSTPIQESMREDQDLAEELRSLSETSGWYDEALFSPAVSVPKANTSNIDWYGGSLRRDGVSQQSCLHSYHRFYPFQSSPEILASTTPSPGIVLPEQIVCHREVLKTDSLPTSVICPDISSWECAPLSGRYDTTEDGDSEQCPDIFIQEPPEILAMLSNLDSYRRELPLTLYVPNTEPQLSHLSTYDILTSQQCTLYEHDPETSDMVGQLLWELCDGVVEENLTELIIPDNYSPAWLNHAPTFP